SVSVGGDRFDRCRGADAAASYATGPDLYDRLRCAFVRRATLCAASPRTFEVRTPGIPGAAELDRNPAAAGLALRRAIWRQFGRSHLVRLADRSAACHGRAHR